MRKWLDNEKGIRACPSTPRVSSFLWQMPCGDASEDSESDNKQNELAARYRLLGLRHCSTNTSPKVFHLAIQELEGCFSCIYTSSYAARELRAQLFTDAMHFVEAASTLQYSVPLQLAVASMVKSAAKVLPHQRSRDLSSMLKKCQIEHSRSFKKTGSVMSEDEEERCDSPPTSLLDLPLDCLEMITGHLDPISLASLDTTCLRMHQACPLLDHAWKCHCLSLSPNTAIQVGIKWKSQFKRLVLDDPTVLSRWRYRRILVDGKPRWAGPDHDGLDLEIGAVEWCLNGIKKSSMSTKRSGKDLSDSSGDEGESRMKLKLWEIS